MRRLLYGYLRDAYHDVGVFSLDLVEFDRLTRQMALEGAWQPAIERLSAAIAEHTGIRDYLQGEKVVQGFLAVYLSGSGYFVFHTELELAKGYANIVLVPRPERYPGMRHGFVIELKYVRRDPQAEAQVRAKATEAVAQLRRYLADGRLAQHYPDAEFRGMALVFRAGNWRTEKRCRSLRRRPDTRTLPPEGGVAPVGPEQIVVGSAFGEAHPILSCRSRTRRTNRNLVSSP